MKLHEIQNYTADWQHLERYVNDGSDHAYRHQTDVPYEFQPRNDIDYLHIGQVACSPAQDGELSKATPTFPVHPYMIGYYRANGYDCTYTGTPAVPTSSTRTLFVESAKPHFLKLDLPVKISRFDRKLVKSDVQFSEQIDAIFENWPPDDSSFGFGVLREVRGGYFTDVNGRQPGFLERNLKPTWLTGEEPAKDYYMIPAFSLISRDNKQPDDQPLIVQLAEQSELDPATFVYEQVLKPMFDFWNELASRGLIWEMQGQNTLLAIDSNGRPCGVVIRDYDAAYINPDLRAAHEDMTPYIKHVLLDPVDTKERYSLVFDHRLCKQNLARIIACVGKHYGQDAANTITAKMQTYIDETMHASLRSNLPGDHWYTYPDIMFEQKIPTEIRPNPPLRTPA